MYFLYVDESGDPGPYNGRDDGNSKHFILSGVTVPIADWNESFDRLKDFRRRIKQQYGLAVREEIHASELVRINSIDAYRRIRKADRLAILTSFIREMPALLPSSRIINICLDKSHFSRDIDIKTLAWSRLIQRYDNYLGKEGNERGVIVADGIDDNAVRARLRKMRVYNPLPSYRGGYYNRPTSNIVEDPFHRDSKHSYFTQVADVIAHALYRMEYPKGSLKKYGLDKAFQDLDPILLKQASGSDTSGIVRK